MKFKWAILTIISVVFVAATAPFSSNQTNQPLIEQIVERHNTAMGGLTNLKNLNSVVMTGSVTVTVDKKTQTIPLSLYRLQDKAFKLEVTFNGKTGYQIMTKTEGWSYMPFQGQTNPQPASADAVEKSQDELNLHDDFFGYPENKVKLEFLGVQTINNQVCYKVKSKSTGDLEKAYYIDTTSYLTVKEFTKQKVDGKDVVTENSYSDFRLSDGVMFPYNINQVGFGNIHFDKISVNVPIDESIFKVVPPTEDELQQQQQQYAPPQDNNNQDPGNGGYVGDGNDG
ncbi:MAG: hypothetical protein QM528_01085 [Phycisphaerales bacterium]|nr:hypothetical protein [Phycisphaerales bacterium]